MDYKEEEDENYLKLLIDFQDLLKLLFDFQSNIIKI